MANCWDESARELVHKNHTATSQTITRDEGSAVVTYEVYRCQCGAHTLEIFKSATEKGNRS